MKNITNLLFSIGIPDTYKGFYYLTDAMTLALEDENRLLSFTTTIFPAIAQKHHTNIRCIERDIRTVINICWNSDFRPDLIRICPYRLIIRPSVGEFLDILFWELSQNE